jgi:predicted hotdog family 3-hydroxylacyl-ACP dehydratase
MSLPADTERYMVHRAPLRLVHQLLRVEDDHAEAQTVLELGGVGVGPDGRVEAAVLLELVAQTYAAAQGYQNRLADRATGTPNANRGVGDPVTIGYLVGAQNFHVEASPVAGRPLVIKIKSSCAFSDFHFVDGQVLCDGIVVAHGTLKVWVPPDAKGGLMKDG